MKPASHPARPGIASFRTKLLVAMMLVISAITALAVWVAQRRVAADAGHDLQQSFESDLASLRRAREIRNAVLTERCRFLVRRPRIHAALEDDALDLLYPSAVDELGDVMARDDDSSTGEAMTPLRAKFYRFLNSDGSVISPKATEDVGDLRAEDEKKISLPKLSEEQQIGYLFRKTEAGDVVDEIVAAPIISTETNDLIAAIALGFRPFEIGVQDGGMRRGIWTEDGLHLPTVSAEARSALVGKLSAGQNKLAGFDNRFEMSVDGAPYLLFCQQLNRGSMFPAAYEVCLYPLSGSLARQSQVRWQILGAGVVLLLGGLGASHIIAGRFSVPVEQLAVDSARNLAKKEEAEAALEATSLELKRSIRFSSDASHQLKTPVTVLRAGLEEIMARPDLPSEAWEEVSGLIHQTFRLTTMIEDLLLLSRMEGGRLHLDFSAVDLSALLDALLDDLSAVSDEMDLEVETDFPPSLLVSGEKRYLSLVLQNLLENARKYNRPAGKIRITAHEEGDWAVLTIANTGRGIPEGAQEHVFERFHRAAVGENVPGHGLGLNLARELARLHGGDVRLVFSDGDWTEFEVRFRLARLPSELTEAVTA